MSRGMTGLPDDRMTKLGGITVVSPIDFHHLFLSHPVIRSSGHPL